MTGITREMLQRWFPGDKRMQRAMEQQRDSIAASEEGLNTTATATQTIQDASVLVLASNGAFNNERVLSLGKGLSGDDRNGVLTIQTSRAVPTVNGGYAVTFVVVGATQVRLPLSGTLATVGNAETLASKTLDAPKLSGLGNYADDTAAATGGVPVGGVYRNGSVLQVRVT